MKPKILFVTFLLLLCHSYVAFAQWGRATTRNVVIQEEDGSPKGKLRTLKVTNSALTKNSEGNYSLATSSVVFDTVANLPGSPSAGDLAGVTDGADESDCDTGGGTDYNVCIYNGSSWVIVGDGTAAAASGDSITVNSVGADTTGNLLDNIYMDFDLTDGGPGGPDDITAKFEYAQTLAGNPALAVDECTLFADTSGGGFICEGSTANTNEQLYRFPDADGADTTEYIVVADDANVSAAEAGHLDGVTSAIQTQLDAKLPLAGGTLTGEVVVDNLGLEFTAGDDHTNCSAFAATGGGIFFDDSEGIFKKCQDNTLTDLDTGGAEVNNLETNDPPNVEDTEVYIGTGAGAGAWAALSGDATMSNSGVVTVVDDLHDHTYANIDDGALDFAEIKYDNTLAGNPALAVDECFWFADTSGGGVICEGSTANTNEQLYRLPNVDGADTTEYFVMADDANVSAAEAGYLDGVTSQVIDDDRIDTFSELDTIVADKGLFNIADNFNISGTNEIQDDVDLNFGNDADWSIQYDEGVDNQLIFETTATSAVATTDPMFEILVGTTPTADQQVFGVAKGTQASNTPLLTVDEDGDAIIAGTATIQGAENYIQFTAGYTADPCTSAGTSEVPDKSIFHNTTADELCWCNASGVDVRTKDHSTACF